MMPTHLQPKRDIVWPNKARLSVLITFDFEAEEDTWFYHDPEAEIDFRDQGERQFDGRRGIWRVLRILKKHDVKCTFFSCGATVEKYPEAARQILADGHEIAGHAYNHEYFDRMTPENEVAAINNMFRAFDNVLGMRPKGFRSCSPSDRTFDNLRQHGIKYDSTFLGQDLPYQLTWPNGDTILELPNGFGGDASHFGHPVGRARSSGRLGIPSQVLSNWKRDFNMAYERGATRTEMMLICLHPYHVGRPARAKALDEFLTHIRTFENVWMPTCDELADFWLDRLQAEPAAS